MNKKINRIIMVAIAMIITAIGASLGIKIAIGVGAWDALSQSISMVLGVKVGTFSMILNISCVLVQIFLLKDRFKFNHLAQIGVSILLGTVVNFMIYKVLSEIMIDNYFISMSLFILSVVMCALGIAMITAINLISFPLESCCMVLAKKINKNFGSIRQGVDIIAIIISLIITFIFKNSMTVREGTIIAMLIFGPMLDLFVKLMSPSLRKLSLIRE
ncbi:YczE/YyaS/YitT family protein [Clostridium intestinale]|uniref:YitT family protein n=1 Tax=Clostridium intestinale TaxID=36845 RepID=A0A7D7A1E7_9CLOT|nr:hypothetical protein [Clostridium intestinale]QLY80735.1 hypothetical protein HZF06_03860 [Clostridium intestinale]